MRKRFVGVMVAVCVLAIAVYFFLCFRSAMQNLSNADCVAGVDYAIGHFLNGQKEFATNSLVSYIECNYPNIHINNGEVLDKNNRPMRISINNATNSFYIKVSSSGKDGVWGTKDDLKREGYFEKEPRQETDHNKTTENSDTASTITNAAIRIHGDFRIVTGTYDITVSANGHITYSNYPLLVKRSELGPAEVTNILSEMRKVGFWKLDAQALSNAVSEVVVQDATRITLMAAWQGEERAITFERDRMLSPVVGKSGAVESLCDKRGLCSYFALQGKQRFVFYTLNGYKCEAV